MSPSDPSTSQQPFTSSGTPDSAFSRIALSLSGGGFRASTYSLGTLNALYLLGLLDNVHMLSTASGGTITGAFYALWRKKGKPFEMIYKEFYEFLQQDALLKESLRQWKNNIDENKGHYKLINAFADIYDRDLYDNARFGVFWQPDLDSNKPFHLQSIIFGSTELYSGLTFRFQYASCMPETITDKRGEARPSFLVGNGNVHIKSDRARELRIADTVAASSCFPGGFEPLILPYDFFSSYDIQPALLDANGKEIEKNRIALVDGGVYDNQGIESLLNANLRNRSYCKNSTEFLKNSPAEQNLLQPSTLLLIADVDSAGKDLYNTPLPGPTRISGATFGQLGTVRSTAQWILLVLFIFSLFSSYQNGVGNFWAGLLAGLSAIGFLLTLGMQWLWKKVTGYFKLLGLEIHEMALPPFQSLSVKQLWYLLGIRLSSVLTLLSSVFLRRVRGLDYGLVFGRNNGLSSDVIVLPSIIGGIVKDFNNLHNADPLHPSVRDELAAIYETVRTASEMSTTLWWLEDKHRLNAIMASAELTLCYRLLRQFEKNPPLGTRGIELQRRSKLIWTAFQIGGKGFHLHPGLLQDIEDSNTNVSQLIVRATVLNSL